jgi:glycosyltransferase involved in cell wall biosynthesis
VIAPHVTCIIPAFNAEATLASVLRGARAALPGAHIVCVDDGSVDATRAIAAAGSDETIVLERNRGKGYALRVGFEAAMTRGARVIVTMDADGQHDPAFAPHLVAALENADIVVGARDLSGVAIPFHRRLGNTLSTAAARLLTKHRLRDSQSGFRAIGSTVLQSIRARGDRYEFETDFLLLAAKAGFRIAEVPISAIYGAPSHFREIRDSLRVTRVLVSHIGGGLRR